MKKLANVKIVIIAKIAMVKIKADMNYIVSKHLLWVKHRMHSDMNMLTAKYSAPLVHNAHNTTTITVATTPLRILD